MKRRKLKRCRESKFLLRCQLELSVKTTSLICPAPSFSTTLNSPATSGLLPCCSLITLSLKAFAHQSSTEPKSPSRTTISILREDSGPDVTIVLDATSMSTIQIRAETPTCSAAAASIQNRRRRRNTTRIHSLRLLRSHRRCRYWRSIPTLAPTVRSAAEHDDG
ncbi:unnamed protein product [Linum trigynum]|uniref:Uncharacterized protein n=1 Tax=Linum trigynum TaxID=586398 RepID=A0AAV2GC95_9ROSI